MIDFEYFAPSSLKEALTIMGEHGDKARALAGGSDLIVQMKDGGTRPGVLVDVKNIPELNRLEFDNQRVLHIGAAVPISRVTNFPTVMTDFNILHQACSLIGSVQIKNRASIGGNICNAAPSADSPPPLLCLGARAVISEAGGTRTVPLEGFFRGPGQTVLTPNELLVEIEIPAPPGNSAGYYLRHTTREEMDIAVVGVASFLVFSTDNNRCQEARIALGAVAPTPIRVPGAESFLTGKSITGEIIEEAAEQAAAAASPITDIRGSTEYRRALVNFLTRRTLEKAWLDRNNHT